MADVNSDAQGYLGPYTHERRYSFSFDKLIAPLAKNSAPFSLTKTLCEREAYMAITTTDDNVYKYIISIMEAIHKLPKNTKWESTKPKAQAINTGPGNAESVPNKGKGKGKGKKKGPPLPDGKGKGGKGKGKGKSQSTSKSSRLCQTARVIAKVQHQEVNHHKANPPVTMSRRNPSSAHITLHLLGVFEARAVRSCIKMIV